MKDDQPSINGSSQDQYVAREVYERHIQRCKDTGNYFAFSRYYPKIMSKIAALFLQDITNLASGKNARTEVVEGKRCFQCTKEFLENSIIGWTDDEQKHHLTSLQEKEFIKLFRHGPFGTRWVYIDFKKIEDAIDAYQNQLGGFYPDSPQLGGKPPNQSGGFYPEQLGGKPPVNKKQAQKQTNKNTQGSPKVNGVLNLNGHLMPDMDASKSTGGVLARKLLQILKNHRKEQRKSNVVAWTGEANKALEKWTFKELDDGLDWFNANMDWQYTPQLYSGTSFFGDFSRIHTAMQRKATIDEKERKKANNPHEDVRSEFIC